MSRIVQWSTAWSLRFSHMNIHRRHFLGLTATAGVGVALTPRVFRGQHRSDLEELREFADDWAEIRGVLKQCTAVYDGERPKIETSGFPDGPLLGNGNTGVVGGGSGSSQMFHITSVNFWDGRYTPVPEEEIRRKGFNWGSTGVKALPIGGITIHETDGDAGAIVQSQDILNAEIKTNAGIHIRTWLSATDQVLVSELSTRSSRPVPVSIETWARVESPDYAAEAGFDRHGNSWATRQTTVDAHHKFVCRAALATKIFGAAVTPDKTSGNTASASFILHPGTTVRVVTVVKVTRDTANHLVDALDKIATLEESAIKRLHAEHLAWWRDFWLKSFVRTHDEQLERFYYGSLYITACSNREGNNPSPLHGPWVTTDTPNWKSNYKLSYNFQMTYSGVCSSNRPELLRPYLDIILNFVPEAQRRSESGYEFNLATGSRWRNPDGSLKFPNGIEGGLLYPLGIGGYGVMSEDSYANMVGMGVWAAAPCIWYYNATQDETFLVERLYPFLSKLAVFWEAYLIKENGRWVIKHSGASERYSNDAINASLDIAFVRFMFANLIPLSRTLGVDDEKVGVWQDIVDSMSAIPTREIEGRTIFVESENLPRSSPWPGYLMIAYPGQEVSPSSTAALRRIFDDTVDYLNPWDQANSSGYLWAACAHAGYRPDFLLERFRAHLRKHMQRNLNVGPKGHGTEGASSLEYINCSMMDSYEGFIRIFPSWPGKNAKFKRLRARGAFLVSAALKDGTIADVIIHSEKGRPCIILNPWPGKLMTISDGAHAVAASREGEMYTFSTALGQRYALKPGSHGRAG